MKDKTRILLKKREANEEKIVELEDETQALTFEMCDIEGSCPVCRNWHYPHCYTTNV